MAILVVASSFHVAVETRQGVAQETFPNTRPGVSQFEDYTDLVIMREGQDVKMCLASTEPDEGAILDWLRLNDMTPELLSTKQLNDYAAQHSLPPNAPTTALAACDAAFPKLREDAPPR